MNESMKYTIKQLNQLKLVGFRVLCAGDQYIVEIPKASKCLQESISEIKQVVNPLIQYGAFVVEPETHEENGYWVCVEVQEYDEIPSNMVTLTIPSQRYAVTRHIGANYQIMDSYSQLHEWINENNYSRLKEKWHLEKFYSWTNTEKVEVELFDTIK
ncbi:GyrI-like domain-containing protein [Bacillus luteolus]|uniref:GyrI-like domain-containing protein n=1 Tax=Litchfieldia luteola TaxID=682179 RepID=A0ABR9QMX1_9BACI|nr:GyrI-like domain-containing protein [Cytobacillus luteolus]MBE4909842.1 GyrI-like domain-containing protein [Cytobacillus luteolus]MBP1942609.1 putative transcriptional regulator YdeE [Cytobacillus luteolus]